MKSEYYEKIFDFFEKISIIFPEWRISPMPDLFSKPPFIYYKCVLQYLIIVKC